MKRFLSRMIPALAVLAIVPDALAENVLVQANVAASCQVVVPSKQDIIINWDPAANPAPPPGTGGFDVRCTKGTELRVTVAGNAGVGTFSRSLDDGTGVTIGYDLSLNGTTTDQTTEYSIGTSTGKNVAMPLDLIVTLDPNADPVAGTYEDTVAITFALY